MGDVLVTYHENGVITREPWRRQSITTEQAFERLQRGRRPPIPPDAGQGCQPARWHNGAMWWRD